MTKAPRKFLIVAFFGALLVAIWHFAVLRQNWRLVFARPPASAPVANDIRIPPDTLLIPKLALSVPVQYVSEISESAFQTALRNGVVHYPGTARPGERGNVYIFGHSSDNPWSGGDYQTIFANLPKLKPGDQIFLTDQQAHRFIYTITTTLVAKAGEMQYLSPGDGSRRLLTLQTSWPIGTALKRYIVRAELVEGQDAKN